MFHILVMAVMAFGNQGNPCKRDVETLCKGATRRAAMKCLKENFDKLSPECKTMATKMKGVFEACREDKNKFCMNTKPGFETMACMKKHGAELSQQCKNEVKELKEAHKR